MTLSIQLSVDETELDERTEARVRRLLETFSRRVSQFSEPKAVARLQSYNQQRLIEVDLRVELGSHAGELISHRSAPTADGAVRLAVEDLERQLERRLSTQRGEPTFGVPSRRLPKQLRPHPVNAPGDVQAD